MFFENLQFTENFGRLINEENFIINQTCCNFKSIFEIFYFVSVDGSI